MAEFKLFVAGVPMPQGSKKGFAFRRKSGSLGVSMVESSKGLKPWRALVSLAAAERFQGTIIEGSVELEVDFYFTRPKSHYRTGKNAHLLKDSAPRDHKTYPDLDKLTRAIGDALAGVVYADDRLICRCIGEKHYGDRPGVRIGIKER